MSEPTDVKSAEDGDEEPLFGDRLIELAEHGQRAMKSYLDRLQYDDGYRVIDARDVDATFRALADKASEAYPNLLEKQLGFMREMNELWARTLAKAADKKAAEPLISPAQGDKRFKADEWSSNPVFDYIKQFYLLAARHMQSVVDDIGGVDAHTKKKAQFYMRQIVDALAPTNFVMTNPAALKAAAESGGETLLRGAKNLLDDIERGRGRLQLKMTDLSAFTPGENIATAPGKVIYRNDLIQLIQYEPATAEAHRTPLLIAPPWINKFYIFDLKPQNSFIKWAVERGHTVFIISWVNPGPELAAKSFEDYMLEGTLAALGAIEEATGEKTANVIGYCIGGTLTASTLAYLAAKGEERVKSVTLLTTLLDFSDVGELSTFIDDAQLGRLEEHMERLGYLEGRHMADAFNLMRENELIWSFAVNNYLLGRSPPAFDLLYWNSDSTRMPAAMHSFYLRNMYQRNLLKEQGGVSLAGAPIDLRQVRTPAFFLSTRDDHIAPWRSTYAGARLFSGPVTFTLGASGHVAGVMNPPAAKKYDYWTNPELPPDPEEWLAGAVQHAGSWWEEWDRWISAFTGEMVPARRPGDGKLAPIEDAPGSYVRVRATD